MNEDEKTAREVVLLNTITNLVWKYGKPYINEHTEGEFHEMSLSEEDFTISDKRLLIYETSEGLAYKVELMR